MKNVVSTCNDLGLSELKINVPKKKEENTATTLGDDNYLPVAYSKDWFSYQNERRHIMNIDTKHSHKIKLTLYKYRLSKFDRSSFQENSGPNFFVMGFYLIIIDIINRFSREEINEIFQILILEHSCWCYGYFHPLCPHHRKT